MTFKILFCGWSPGGFLYSCELKLPRELLQWRIRKTSGGLVLPGKYCIVVVDVATDVIDANIVTVVAEDFIAVVTKVYQLPWYNRPLTRLLPHAVFYNYRDGEHNGHDVVYWLPVVSQGLPVA